MVNLTESGKKAVRILAAVPENERKYIADQQRAFDYRCISQKKRKSEVLVTKCFYFVFKFCFTQDIDVKYMTYFLKQTDLLVVTLDSTLRSVFV